MEPNDPVQAARNCTKTCTQRFRGNATDVTGGRRDLPEALSGRQRVRSPTRVGDHPVIVLTINVLISRLSAVAVAVVTGTEGPEHTHIPLDRKSGLTSYDISYANATDLHTIAKSRLRRRRGKLYPDEPARLKEAVRLYLDL